MCCSIIICTVGEERLAFGNGPNTQLMVEIDGDALGMRSTETAAGASLRTLAESICAAQFSRRSRQDAVLIEQCTCVCFTVKTSKV